MNEPTGEARQGNLGAVTIDAGDFLGELDQVSPDRARLVSEHLVDNEGELLLHLLVADVGRLVESAYKSGDDAVLKRCLEVLDRGLVDGDEHVSNAVAVSFVEHMVVDLPKRAFKAWPDGLRNEAERMLSWRPGDDELWNRGCRPGAARRVVTVDDQAGARRSVLRVRRIGHEPTAVRASRWQARPGASPAVLRLPPSTRAHRRPEVATALASLAPR